MDILDLLINTVTNQILTTGTAPDSMEGLMASLSGNGVQPQQTPSNYPNLLPNKAIGAYNAPKLQQDIANFLAQKGISQPHAQGILANIAAESGFNPRAVGDSGTSIGLFQHHNERADALRRFAGADVYNPLKQVEFALSEPDTQRYLQQQFRTPQDASKWWTTQWERPANAEAEAMKRIQRWFGNQQMAGPPVLPPQVPEPAEAVPSQLGGMDIATLLSLLGIV